MELAPCVLLGVFGAKMYHIIHSNIHRIWGRWRGKETTWLHHSFGGKLLLSKANQSMLCHYTKNSSYENELLCVYIAAYEKNNEVKHDWKMAAGKVKPRPCLVLLKEETKQEGFGLVAPNKSRQALVAFLTGCSLTKGSWLLFSASAVCCIGTKRAGRLRWVFIWLFISRWGASVVKLLLLQGAIQSRPT